MNDRQQAQQHFDRSGAPLIVGDRSACPIPPEELAELTAQSPGVVEVIRSGLTAEVFHLRFGTQEYTLKKRRPTARVSNADGKYSFLNEVQRRADFTRLKSNPEYRDRYRNRFNNIVDTLYADYRLGIILSPWINGAPLRELTPALFAQLFQTLMACEEHGLMEWDLCSGNLLVDQQNKLWLFDFGYMYPYDPLTSFNSNGQSDPIFHAAERFETRFFFGWLLSQTMPDDDALQVYRQMKEAEILAYQSKLAWLKNHQADPVVIRHFAGIVRGWQDAIQSQRQLKKQFAIDSFRSHVLDIEDDLHGRSCTGLTLKRIDAVTAMLDAQYEFIRDHGGLFYANEGKTKQTLIDDYRQKYREAIEWQITP